MTARSPKKKTPVPMVQPERRIRRAVISILAVVAFGTAGYTIVEGWDPWQSLFFTLVTITTVGYGDYGLSESGERFTAILLLVGIALVTYSASQIIQEVIELHENGERRMRKQIDALNNHQIVCGYGRIGQTVCRTLADEGVPVLVIDRGETVVEQAIKDGFPAIRGDATTDETLLLAGIHRAAGGILLTSSDSENLVITIALREHREDFPIISRAESEEAVNRMRRSGAARVISPIRTGGRSIAQAVLEPSLASLVDVADASDDSVRLSELTVTEALHGRTIRHVGAEHPDVVFVSMRSVNGGPQRRPGIDHAFQEGDTLVLAGTARSLHALRDDAMRRAA